MKKFAELVEEVKNLSIEEKGELSVILDHILIDERRNEILKNHHLGLDELKSGKLKFYDKAEDILTTLNED
jgi:hypothetical protein